MIIEIPFKTPTVNHLYFNWQNRRILTKEARKLKESINELLEFQYANQLVNKKLKVKVDVYENWLTKKGKVARKDVSNREKFLIDSVFNALDLDDKFIFSHQMNKIQSDEEKCIIEVEEYE